MKSRVIVAILGICVVWGCGARMETAKNKVLKKIDEILGELDVKRTEIATSMKGLREGIDGLGKAKIRASVKLEQVGRDLDSAQNMVSRVDNALKVIRPNLNKKEPSEIAGTSYTPEKLTDLANKLLQERKTRSVTADGLQQAKAALAKTVSVLLERQEKYKADMARLEGQLVEIDAKMVAAKAMKEASASMGESDLSMENNVANLETKVKDLFVDVEVALRSENEKWDQAATVKQIDSVDATLTRLEGSPGAAAEIDKILGTAK